MRWIKTDFESTIGKVFWWYEIIGLWKKVWAFQRLKCKCTICWEEKEIRWYHILKWMSGSCWCVNKRHKDIVWRKYGKLTITKELENRNWRRYVEARCECWKVIECNFQNLKCWHPVSCWCYFEQAMKLRRKYWSEITREMRIHTIRNDMQARVKWRHNKKYYYDKWIKCEWNNFWEFLQDMKESYDKHVEEYWEKNTTIDRINCNWNYSKENCRRATYKEQYLNRDCMKNKQIIQFS